MRTLRLGVAGNDPAALLAVQRLNHALDRGSANLAPALLGARPFREALLSQLLNKIEVAFELGRLMVTEGGFPLLDAAPDFPLIEPRFSPEPPPPPPKRAPAKQRSHCSTCASWTKLAKPSADSTSS